MSELKGESPEVYERILNNEGFLNDLWNKYDVTTKYEILEKSSCDMVKEYEDYLKRNNEELDFSGASDNDPELINNR